jgi:hypothetical protein
LSDEWLDPDTLKARQLQQQAEKDVRKQPTVINEPFEPPPPDPGYLPKVPRAYPREPALREPALREPSIEAPHGLRNYIGQTKKGSSAVQP